MFGGKRKKVFVGSAVMVLAMGMGASAESAAGSVQNITTYLSNYDQDTYDTYGTGFYQVLKLDEEATDAYPALAASLADYGRVLGMDTEKTFEEEAMYARQAMQENDYAYQCALEYSQSLRRFDDRFCSFVTHYYGYTGGVHGYYSNTGHNYDSQTGDEIALESLITDMQALRSVLSDKLRDRYPQIEEETGEAPLYSFYVADEEISYNWVIDPAGLIFFFNPYEIASYAAGAFEVRLDFDEKPELFAGADLATEDGYIFQLSQDLHEQVDLNADGAPEDLSVYSEANEYGDQVKLHVQVNQATCTIEDYFYDVNAWLVHTAEGHNYLYAELLYDNDYHSIQVFDLNHASPFWVGTVNAGIAQVWDGQADANVRTLPTNPEQFYLATRMYMLSTYEGFRVYSVDEAGMPQPVDPLYVAAGSITLQTARQLTAKAIDPVTLEETDTPVTLEAGESLTIWRTDGDAFVDLYREDGSPVRLYYDAGTQAGEWPRTIAGISEEECFAVLYYAG